jgi:hypothetical protein
MRRSYNLLLHISNPEVADLDIQVEICAKQWKVFQQELEDEKKLQSQKKSKWPFKSSKKPAGLLMADPPKPSLNDVIEAVQASETAWKEKERLGHGKVQKTFHAFCKIGGRHKSLLEMLPSQNEYFSVLCGAITMLIKASSNHQKTAEGLGKALLDITSDLDLCIETVRLMQTDDMKEAISNLYIHVFHFLHSAMGWFQSGSWRKVLNSLNDDFYTIFEDQLTKIKRISSLMLHKSQIKSQYELRDLRLAMIEEARRSAEERAAAREDRLISYAWRKEIGKAFSDLVGQSMYKTAESNVEAWRFQGKKAIAGPGKMQARTLSIENKGLKVGTRRSQRRLKEYRKSDLEKWSRHLDDYTSDVEEFLENIDADTKSTERAIINEIQEWGGSTTSQSLWVVGRFEQFYPTSTTAIAVKVVTSAQALQVPVICYLCHPNSNCGQDDDAAESVVMDLIYSMIRQLIYLLPRDVHSSANLGKTRFSRLNGEISSFWRAMKLLYSLIDLAPKTLLIVIDGLEQLDDSVVAEEVEEMLEFLQEVVSESSSGSEKRLLKILFTTAGPSEILENLDEDNLNTIEARYGSKKQRRKRETRLVNLDLSDMSDYDTE